MTPDRAYAPTKVALGALTTLDLRPQLATLGIAVSPQITQSNGGIISFATAEHHRARFADALQDAAFVGGLTTPTRRSPCPA